MLLSHENYISIIKAFDGTFEKLESLSYWPTTYPQKSRVATAKYSTGTGTDNEQTRAIVIETGSRAVVEADAELMKLVAEKTSMTLPMVLKIDHSGDTISDSYIILNCELPDPNGPTELIRLDRALDNLAPREKALLELRLGSQLRELHAVDNLWFGVPGDEAEWGECISWQEAFTLLLETALMELETRGLDKPQGQSEGEGVMDEPVDALPLKDLRRALASAIAFYLFDDVEVPSLVMCASLDWACGAFTRAPSGGGPGYFREVKATEENGASPVYENDPPFLLGRWADPVCFWGDPLMEGAFRTPSAALLEGYGEPGPILFARQRTKRLWYTAYGALCTMLGAAQDADDLTAGVELKEGEELKRQAEARLKSARMVLVETARALKDAPCY